MAINKKALKVFIKILLLIIFILIGTLSIAALSANKSNVPPSEDDGSITAPPQNSPPLPSKPETEAPRKSEQANFTTHARLHLLNKVTAHTSTIDIEKGRVLQFGSLTLDLQNCWRSSSGDMPESAALLKIMEQKNGEDKKQIFFGWMFASSPSVSGLEHAVYDVVVLQCY